MDEQLRIYLKMRDKYAASVDDVLESPELRQEFLESAWNQFPTTSERDLLHRLVYLRKKAKLLPSKSH
jgi:hypothetical protein